MMLQPQTADLDAPASPTADRDRLIADNAPLATWWCSRYKHRARQSGLDWDDMTQEAQLALIRAVGRYRPDLGPFAPYANVYVRGAIRQAFAAQKRAPRPVDTSGLAITADRGDLIRRDTLRSERAAERIDCGRDQDFHIADGPEDAPRPSRTPSDASRHLRHRLELMADAVETLPPLEANVLLHYVGLGEDLRPWSVREIAAHLHKRPSAIRQMIDETLALLRWHILVAEAAEENASTRITA